jgi:hypothetical protein
MPTGLNNSPQGLTDSGGIIGAGAKPGSGALIPRSAINQSVRMIFAVTGVAQVSQPVHVPANCNVYIRAHNGTASGNTAPARVALNPEGLALGSSSGDVVTPDTEINYPVDNLAQIWGVGTAGDGLIISIRASTQV